MSQLISHQNRNIIVLTVLIGLGSALSLPYLANSFSLAADSAPLADEQCTAISDDGSNMYTSGDNSALQTAVDGASPGDTITVYGKCQGVSPHDGISATVYISKSLTLRGEYPSFDRSQFPDPDDYPAVLDAQRGGYVVVIDGDIDVFLDNLFITGGAADEGGGMSIGGGIVSSGALTLTYSVIYSNTAESGGGIYNGYGSLYIFETEISGNKADSGGGLFNNEGRLDASGVQVIGNKAEYGGGMLLSKGNTDLEYITFTENEAAEEGGGLLDDGGSPELERIYFEKNKAKSGGGMMSENGSYPSLRNASFVGNSATLGGGMLTDESFSFLEGALFSGNKAGLGGGFFNDSGSSGLVNTTFSGNRATEFGGGMLAISANSLIQNSIFWNNRDKTGTGTISATIVHETSTFSITNSLVQSSGGSGSWALEPAYQDGGNNIDDDPIFIEDLNPASAPTKAGNLRLQKSSPAVDKGDNQFVFMFYSDLDGYSRIMDGDADGTATIDMGVYEYLLEYPFKNHLPAIFR